MGMKGESIPKEALDYPHETSKKYKKDTPGQTVDTAVKEDAEEMARVIATQAGERERIKERHKRELESLAGRQKQARERARAALPRERTNEEFEKFITEYGTDTARKWSASQYAAMRDKKLNPPRERKPGDPSRSTVKLNIPMGKPKTKKRVTFKPRPHHIKPGGTQLGSK